MHPVERNVIPHHSRPVPILTAHEAGGDTKNNNTETCQEFEEKTALLKTPISCNRKFVTVARQVKLRKVRDTTVLVSAQEAGIIELIPDGDVARNQACMTAKRIIDVYSTTFLYYHG